MSGVVFFPCPAHGCEHDAESECAEAYMAELVEQGLLPADWKIAPKPAPYPELHVADPRPLDIPYWMSPRGDDHVLVSRVADALTRFPGSPLSGLGLDDRERAVRRILAEVERCGYVVRRGERA